MAKQEEKSFTKDAAGHITLKAKFVEIVSDMNNFDQDDLYGVVPVGSFPIKYRI